MAYQVSIKIGDKGVVMHDPLRCLIVWARYLDPGNLLNYYNFSMSILGIQLVLSYYIYYGVLENWKDMTQISSWNKVKQH